MRSPCDLAAKPFHLFAVAQALHHEAFTVRRIRRMGVLSVLRCRLRVSPLKGNPAMQALVSNGPGQKRLEDRPVWRTKKAAP
jgi:hypothetical protein